MKKHKSSITISAVLIAVLFIFSFSAFADRGAGVSKEMLPSELKGITISNAFLPSSGKEAGVIQVVSGTVIVAHEGLKQAYFAAAGDKIYEKDTFFTLQNSRCRFRLLFEDVITVGDNAKISVTKFIDDNKTKEKHASFNMLKGKVMFYTMRLFRYKTSTMEVETPTAIAGVRGTMFGVEVAELAGTKTAALPINVAGTSDLGFRLLAQANPPSLPQFQTTILCFSGTIFTGSTAPPPPGAPPPPVVTLSQGQMTTVGSGAPPAPPSITPPALANSFLAGTSVPSPGGSGAPPSPPTPTSSEGSPALTSAPLPDTSTVTQTQNTQTVTPAPEPTPIPAGRTEPWTGSGYFTGLLSVEDSGRQFVGAYISTTPQNFTAAVTAGDSTGGPYAITADGPSESVTGISTSFYGIFSGSKPATIVELGYTEYMSWGSWTQPLAMPTDSESSLYLDNPNYYLSGTITPTLPLTGVYDYAGPAQGTLYSAAGGTVMTGNFTATVDFTSAQITNYNMAVANGANTAAITNAAIAINPGSPHFSTTQANGAWTLIVNGVGANGNVTANGSGRLYGSFFGANAENMGSVWTMSTASGKAAGIAVGNYRAPAVP